jgi:hypothetical protein
VLVLGLRAEEPHARLLLSQAGTRVDLGQVRPATSSEVVCRIDNDTSAAMTLRVEPMTCACQNTRLEPATLTPGGTGWLRFQVDHASREKQGEYPIKLAQVGTERFWDVRVAVDIADFLADPPVAETMKLAIDPALGPTSLELPVARGRQAKPWDRLEVEVETPGFVATVAKRDARVWSTALTVDKQSLPCFGSHRASLRYTFFHGDVALPEVVRRMHAIWLVGPVLVSPRQFLLGAVRPGAVSRLSLRVSSRAVDRSCEIVRVVGVGVRLFQEQLRTSEGECVWTADALLEDQGQDERRILLEVSQGELPVRVQIPIYAALVASTGVAEQQP